MWTWVKGDSIGYPSAVFGTLGIPSPLTTPAGNYEAELWVDQQNTVWMYAGYPNNPDMWKFNMQTLEWTWVAGTGGTPANAVYGIRGVSSPLNQPRSNNMYSMVNWTDRSGNLWLMEVLNSVMWKFDTQILEWTWMSGDTVTLLPPVFGIQGVPSPLNTPGTRAEQGNSWVDASGNLWVFGGWHFSNYYSDMWLYDVMTNEWTWMKGPDTSNQLGNYGTIGIPDPLNNPAARGPHSKWTDSNGNFWIFGGGTQQNYFNDTWMFNISTYEWTWMNGLNGGYYNSGLCISSSMNLPDPRWEHRSSWSDPTDNFWMYGGSCYSATCDDLWHYNPLSNIWTLISGNIGGGTNPVFGTLGIPQPTNSPGARIGAVSWMDNSRNLWMFGGAPSPGPTNDIWKFVLDTSCTTLNNLNVPIAAFFSDTNLCAGSCIDFFNLSFNSNNFQWNFPGANPNTSTVNNPTNICYFTPGIYDVTLISSNQNITDTLTLQNYITVYPFPPAQSITQIGDTLFAIAGPSSYQWYFNGNIINGATDYFYVATQSGNYNVVATDSNGCEVEAVINNVIASSQLAVSNSQLVIFPNPVEDRFTMHNAQCMIGAAVQLSIYNIMGEKVYTEAVEASSQNQAAVTVDCELLPSGLYFLEIITAEKSHRTKFLKQ